MDNKTYEKIIRSITGSVQYIGKVDNDKEISEKWFLEALDRANNEIDKMDLKQKKYNAQNEMDANMKINDAQKWLEKRRKIEYEERM